MLTNVTLTGADDSVDPKDLIELSIEFPFAEWGILIGSRGGVPRFPSGDWFAKLMNAVAEAHPHYVPLSLHVCGKLLRSILLDGAFHVGAAVEIGEFRRMQLNFHGEEVASPGEFRDCVVNNICAVQTITRIPEIIVQLDGVNDWILDALLARKINASGLYDRSHGAGVVPDNWPAPNPAWEIGYAGGLGPNEIASQMRVLLAVASPQRFWIDMETKVRSEDGGKFDLWKCRSVLDSCAKFFPTTSCRRERFGKRV